MSGRREAISRRGAVSRPGPLSLRPSLPDPQGTIFGHSYEEHTIEGMEFLLRVANYSNADGRNRQAAVTYLELEFLLHHPVRDDTDEYILWLKLGNFDNNTLYGEEKDDLTLLAAEVYHIKHPLNMPRLVTEL